MDFFKEIDDLKKELPTFKSISKKVGKRKYNGYQMFSIITFCICIVLGVVFGNLFPTCGSSASIFSNLCINREFNFSLMLFFWFISFIVCLFFFAIGSIIDLLTSINSKIDK